MRGEGRQWVRHSHGHDEERKDSEEARSSAIHFFFFCQLFAFTTTLFTLAGVLTNKTSPSPL